MRDLTVVGMMLAWCSYTRSPGRLPSLPLLAATLPHRGQILGHNTQHQKEIHKLRARLRLDRARARACAHPRLRASAPFYLHRPPPVPPPVPPPLLRPGRRPSYGLRTTGYGLQAAGYRLQAAGCRLRMFACVCAWYGAAWRRNCVECVRTKSRKADLQHSPPSGFHLNFSL